MRSRLIAPFLALVFAAGCAVKPPERTPRLTPSDDILPNFIVPDARARMVFLARQEWTLFGRPVVIDNGIESFLEFPPGVEASHEVQGPMLSRVLTYWYAVSVQPIVGFQGELRPWSAAFISWLATSAGLSRSDFPPSVLHWDYIAHALNGNSARFVARDASDYAPRVGDLLCAPRGEAFVAEVRSFSELRRGAYHCDLVVERRADVLDAIGGNVGDAVSLTRVALDTEGRVVPTALRPWVVVLEQRAALD